MSFRSWQIVDREWDYRSRGVKRIEQRWQSCGEKGGVRGMARQLGLESLEVITPSGREWISFE